MASSRRTGWIAAALSLLWLAGSPAPAAMLWGANGHPFTAYPGLSFDEQIRLLAGAGLTSYRVDVNSIAQMDRLGELIAAAKPQGITILPVLIPPADLTGQDETTLHDTAYAFAQAFVTRFGPQVPVWELANELESFAIIQPCETRDDGTRYPCEWGVAGGVGALDYVGSRFSKVEAVIRGLSEGVHAASPTALRAVGTAGWGHVGVFERLHRDGVAWDLSVWHLYGEDPEWAFKALAGYGKPIWVTELNYPFGSSKEGEARQAAGLVAMMRRLTDLSGPYRVQAAFVYELCDEPYWAPSFEASMGLVHLVPSGKAWTVGPAKAAYGAVKALVASGGP